MGDTPSAGSTGPSLPDIHFDPPQQQRHSGVTMVYAGIGLVLGVVGAYLFIHQQSFFVSQESRDTPTTEKAAAIASVKARAEAEERPKLTREEKMQFLGVLETGEATSTEGDGLSENETSP